ncbi:hypothetical protein [Paraburkholderia largidicola]|uniref:hypothetical protein n=1 Tax=Paraburkholderia largidicola TaxID=3014751 RepID=UPI0015DA6743|nr:hypothetical protein [Paraburkholderia sp. PGU16]GJH33049.1 hypothetical protein CBA19CS91_09850 [Paraburkholderia hospita]
MDNLVLVSGINQCPGKKVEIENGSADQINFVLCDARSGRGYDEYKRERESESACCHMFVIQRGSGYQSEDRMQIRCISLPALPAQLQQISVAPFGDACRANKTSRASRFGHPDPAGGQCSDANRRTCERRRVIRVLSSNKPGQLVRDGWCTGRRESESIFGRTEHCIERRDCGPDRWRGQADVNERGSTAAGVDNRMVCIAA